MRISQSLLALVIAVVLVSPAFAGKSGNGNNGNGNDGSAAASGVAGGNGNAGGNRNENASGRSRSGNTSKSPTDEVGAVPNDQEVARDAVRSKSALSLERITAIVRGDTDGRILDLQLVTLKGVYLYEVTVLETSGVLHKLYYNSRTGVRLRTN